MSEVPPRDSNDTPENPLENFSVDVAAAEPVKKRGRSKRVKKAEPVESAEPESGNIGVGEQPDIAPGDTGDAKATGPTVVEKVVPTPEPVAEKSPEEKRAELVESVKKQAEAIWEKFVADGKLYNKADFIAQGQKRVEGEIREEGFKTLTKEQHELLNSLASARGTKEKAQEVIDLFAAGVSLDDLKNIKFGFLGRVNSQMFEKPMSEEKFNAWAKEKIEEGNKRISEIAVERLGIDWDSSRKKEISRMAGARLAEIDVEEKKAEERVKNKEEQTKKIEEAIKESDKQKVERIDMDLLIKDRMELLNDLRNQWRDMEKMNAVLLPKHKDFGKKIKAIDGVIYDPKTDKEKIKDALQQNTADIILKAEILSGENLREGAAGKTGKAYRKYLTEQVERIFDEQIKKIEDETGQKVKFTKKGTAPASKPVVPPLSPFPEPPQATADKSFDPLDLGEDDLLTSPEVVNHVPEDNLREGTIVSPETPEERDRLRKETEGLDKFQREKIAKEAEQRHWAEPETPEQTAERELREARIITHTPEGWSDNEPIPTPMPAPIHKSIDMGGAPDTYEEGMRRVIRGIKENKQALPPVENSVGSRKKKKPFWKFW